MVHEAVSDLELQARGGARAVFEDTVASSDFLHDVHEDVQTVYYVFLSFTLERPYYVLYGLTDHIYGCRAYMYALRRIPGY